ncbi:MAG: acyltransferase, partial [Candidatus Rokuibacteriota bacterium]
MAILSREQITQLGLAYVGADVAISDRCSIYGAASISIGDHVRIDDFAILTAREPMVIGSYVHISAFA